ncbi:copper chaperone PCu(A)C [Pseudovibrio sp. SPO723]|uniref:copper chaperone PCu(A)C n=1 Tax=Nesiotobacter zosterae TaxID=392721 RepID=UPI0029C14698|nr:copper chaperone PCu(A)C [Pseudovibrio sp. SPO723]MDX5593120.1 copper chaperone PCu(A)C [Pseudovibrio sp. SPO723]
MLNLKTAGIALALALSPLSFAQAHDIKLGEVSISNAWTRATPPKAKAGGGFLTIANDGSQAVVLKSAASDVAKRTEIHEMAVTDGIMKMREMKDGLSIAPGETLELKPGGYHVMFMGIHEAFTEGETVSVTLMFEPGGPVDVQMPVHKMGSKSAMKHHSTH